MTTPVLHSDALVVGAGSAGSVVAAELSKDSSRTVTVVEAGVGLADPVLAAQAADAFHLPIDGDSRLVRRYRAELTGDGDVAQIVRGATLGGSGAVNGGYFCRALPRDFDGLDIPGWSWADVLEHYRAIETDLDFGGPQHGGSGPIQIRRSAETCGATDQFVSRALRSGFTWIADLNDATSGAGPGVGPVPLNIVDGVRVGPGWVYLAPVAGRPNLTVRTGTRVLRVEIVKGRAVGVEAIGPDGPVRLVADRVILSAGAIESAHLLMLSGVGEQDVLSAAGIAVTAALPVGARCADHPEWLLPAAWDGAPGRAVLEAVLHTDDGIELRPYTSDFGTIMGRGRQGGPQVGVALMRPRARGRLTLVSADPAVPMRIEHRYDAEPADIADLRRGATLARDIVGAAAGAAQPLWSTSQHLCGSAPMGRDGAEWAVVDPQCRVRGIEGLWVIDGSVLPRITSRGPHATIVMLAHRAVAFVGS